VLAVASELTDLALARDESLRKTVANSSELELATVDAGRLVGHARTTPFALSSIGIYIE